jgi:hypothetical protein
MEVSMGDRKSKANNTVKTVSKYIPSPEDAIDITDDDTPLSENAVGVTDGYIPSPEDAIDITDDDTPQPENAIDITDKQEEMPEDIDSNPFLSGTLVGVREQLLPGSVSKEESEDVNTGMGSLGRILGNVGIDIGTTALAAKAGAVVGAGFGGVGALPGAAIGALVGTIGMGLYRAVGTEISSDEYGTGGEGVLESAKNIAINTAVETFPFVPIAGKMTKGANMAVKALTQAGLSGEQARQYAADNKGMLISTLIGGLAGGGTANKSIGQLIDFTSLMNSTKLKNQKVSNPVTRPIMKMQTEAQVIRDRVTDEVLADIKYPSMLDDIADYYGAKDLKKVDIPQLNKKGLPRKTKGGEVKTRKGNSVDSIEAWANENGFNLEIDTTLKQPEFDINGTLKVNPANVKHVKDIVTNKHEEFLVTMFGSVNEGKKALGGMQISERQGMWEKFMVFKATAKNVVADMGRYGLDANYSKLDGLAADMTKLRQIDEITQGATDLAESQIRYVSTENHMMNDMMPFSVREKNISMELKKAKLDDGRTMYDVIADAMEVPVDQLDNLPYAKHKDLILKAHALYSDAKDFLKAKGAEFGEIKSYFPHKALPIQDITAKLYKQAKTLDGIHPDSLKQIKETLIKYIPEREGDIMTLELTKDRLIKYADEIATLESAPVGKQGVTAGSSQKRTADMPDFELDKDFGRVTANYLNSMFKMTYLNDIVVDFRKNLDTINILSSGGVFKGGVAERMKGDLDEYFNNAILGKDVSVISGVISNGMNKMKNSLLKNLVFTENPLVRFGSKFGVDAIDLSSMLGSTFYATKLGGLNFKALIQNSMQPIFQTIPEIGGTYGYSVGVRSYIKAAKNFKQMNSRVKAGGLASDVLRDTTTNVQGLHTSGTKSALEYVNKKAMTLFTHVDTANRFLVQNMADVIASDILKGVPNVNKFVDSMHLTHKNILSKAINSGDEKAISNVIAEYLNANTQYLYSGADKSKVGRALGSLGMFTKFPVLTYSKLKELGKHGDAMGIAHRALLPLIALGGIGVLADQLGLYDTQLGKQTLGSNIKKTLAMNPMTSVGLNLPPPITSAMEASKIIGNVFSGDVSHIGDNAYKILQDWVPYMSQYEKAKKILTED